MPYYPPSLFGQDDELANAINQGYGDLRPYGGPDYTRFQSTGAPAGWTQQADGSMTNNNYQGDSGGGFNFGAMGSGFGAILSLAPQLIGQAKQRQMQKKILGAQHALEAEQFKQKMLNSAVNEGETLRTGQIGQANLGAEMAGRGLANSSINQQGEANRNYEENLRLDAIRRQRALDQFDRNTQLKIQGIQAAGANMLYYMQVASQVANAVGSAAGAAAGAAASDPKIKFDIKSDDTKSALEKIVAIPVKSWRYKADPVNPRLGPMADEVATVIGGDPKRIDLVTMNGLLMAAVQELNKKVAELEKKQNG